MFSTETLENPKLTLEKFFRSSDCEIEVDGFPQDVEISLKKPLYSLNDRNKKRNVFKLILLLETVEIKILIGVQYRLSSYHNEVMISSL